MVATSVSAATPIKIACIGDSITAGHGASNASFAYPSQLQQLLGSDYEVKNYGHSGRTMLKKGDIDRTIYLKMLKVEKFGKSTRSTPVLTKKFQYSKLQDYRIIE
jgi:lysophospholipase L1-like esterase